MPGWCDAAQTFNIRRPNRCNSGGTIINKKSAELDAVLAKASGGGVSGEELPIPRGVPREEMKTVASESGD